MLIQSEEPKVSVKPFIESNVKARVADITEIGENKIKVTYELLSGEHMGCKVTDKLGYTESTKLLWKYLRFRKSIGVPYIVGERIIDTDEAFLNKMVCLDLDIFTTYNKNGEELHYQSVNYVLNWRKEESEQTTGPLKPIDGIKYDNVFDSIPNTIRKV